MDDFNVVAGAEPDRVVVGQVDGAAHVQDVVDLEVVEAAVSKLASAQTNVACVVAAGQIISRDQVRVTCLPEGAVRDEVVTSVCVVSIVDVMDVIDVLPVRSLWPHLRH